MDCEKHRHVGEVSNPSSRLTVVEYHGRHFLELGCRDRNATWRTVLVSGLEAPSNIWTSRRELFCEDPIIEWVDRGAQLQRAEGFFDRVEGGADGKTLVLSGQAGCHAVEGRVSLVGPGQIHVVVTDTVSASPATVRLARLMSQFYFVPDGKAARTTEPLDFAWLPALHKKEEHVCGDHFFRSPAVAVVANGCYAALVPDLDEFAEHRTISHALDLRVADTKIEAPRLSYGVCPSVIDDHVYSKHDAGHAETVDGPVLTYSFDVFFGECETSEDVAEMISSYLWSAYGHRTLQDIRPQVLPFEEYGRRYTYAYELPRSVRRVTLGDKLCAGIDNPHRRGANFHAWENDLHVGYGIRYYGEKWGDESLVETAAGILNLSLSAPRNQGAFPCIYNFHENTYEGTLFWTARSADPYHGYDTAAMSVSAWWQLYWHQDLMESGEILDAAVSYAHFLREAQLSSGAIPTYFLRDLSPAKQLLESATTAVSGAALAKLA
ncbi:MAG: hypothetical protein MUQ10_12510, partial [Anaerolineae bacterium]|nr:hypothetical protein [Anaerolineae bacterium]